MPSRRFLSRAPLPDPRAPHLSEAEAETLERADRGFPGDDFNPGPHEWEYLVDSQMGRGRLYRVWGRAARCLVPVSAHVRTVIALSNRRNGNW